MRGEVKTALSREARSERSENADGAQCDRDGWQSTDHREHHAVCRARMMGTPLRGSKAAVHAALGNIRVVAIRRCSCAFINSAAEVGGTRDKHGIAIRK